MDYNNNVNAVATLRHDKAVARRFWTVCNGKKLPLREPTALPKTRRIAGLAPKVVCAFVMEYSLVSFLFAVLLISVTPCPAICNSGRTRVPVLYGVGATDCMYTYETSKEMRMWLFNVIDNMKRVDMLLHRQHFAHVQQRYQLAAECHAVSTTHKRRPLAAITLQLDMALFSSTKSNRMHNIGY